MAILVVCSGVRPVGGRATTLKKVAHYADVSLGSPESALLL
ncbi:hypothetical protein EMIT0P253_420013 [Pseudomonas sp. IT-P253]